LTNGSLPGFLRAQTFQARRQDFIAWFTVVRRSPMALPSVSVTTSSFSYSVSVMLVSISETRREPSRVAVFQDMAANQLETILVVTLGTGV
jgi:hypothetical protein